MSQVTSPTEPGWLPDPSGRYEWRYWDGGWTNRVANSTPAGAPTAPTSTPDGSVPAAAPAPAPPAAPGPPAAPAAPSPVTAPTPAPDAAPAPLPLPTAPVDDPDAPTAAEVAVAAPAAPMTARDAVPRVPFGTEPVAPHAPPAEPHRARRSPWAVLVGFFKSFSEQPESYHSPLAREPIPTDPRGEHILSTPPGNYGHAGIVALAALGIVVGAYLPWISGHIGLTPFHRSGFDDGLGAGYSLGAVALALSALLSVRMRVLRWLTVILSFVIAGFVVRDVLHTYDTIKQLNQSSSMDADMGWGLWIMIVAAAIAMIGAVRMSETEKIG
jgi:hypothetical protein